jgi:uncharacterized 2Fe-2S/4Fe-4S cluster protein (DUF4445 family)
MAYQIEFEPLGRRIPCTEKVSVLDCARQSNIGLASICGGQGTCKACKIQILKGLVSDMTPVETETFTESQIKAGWRLACRVFPKSDLTVNVPPESMTTTQRTQVECSEVTVKPDPVVKTFDVRLAPASLDDLRSDFTRLWQALKQQNIECHGIDVNVLKNISPQLREWNWEVGVSLREREIVGLSTSGSPSLGLAVDLGTTKIAGYVVDLMSGQTLASKGIMNPQIGYGEDITSRMLVAIKSEEAAKRFQSMVVSAIDELTRELCSQIKAKPGDILDIVIVGNTVMHHLLLGLPVAQLAYSPFIASIQEAVDIKSRDIGSTLSPGAYVHVLPNVAGYVGADHVSMLLAVDAANITKNAIAIDIGTNTEVSIISKGKIISASCASGPAFEGGHISQGMRAAAGAIERFRIIKDERIYQTIGNAPPVGICGSGIIDVLAQLYLAGILEDSGRFSPGSLHTRRNGEKIEFVLVEESEKRPAVTISQSDVRELQLAKSAIRTGIQMLLEEAGLVETEIEQVIIAGAFGTYVDVSSAISIGMLPSLPLDRFHQVGNAAGLGAKIALLSNAKRQYARELASKVQYLELATRNSFNKTFLESTYLGIYRLQKGKRIQ